MKNFIIDTIKSELKGINFKTIPKDIDIKRLRPPGSPKSLKTDQDLDEYKKVFADCIKELKEVLIERKAKVEQYSDNYKVING